MKKTLMFCLFILCGAIMWGQKTIVNTEGEKYPDKKIIVLDVSNGKIDLQKVKQQLVGHNKIKKGSEVVYQSGEELVMTDGFVVEKGAEFIAEVVEFVGEVNEDPVSQNTKETEEVSNEIFEGELNVYPNPTAENLFINLPSISSGEIHMFGTNGQEVFKRQINDEKNIQFSVRELPVGIYILRVVTEKHQYTKKIIKN